MDHETNLDKPLEVYMGKGKLWMLGFGCFIFIGIGGWIFSEYLNGNMTFIYGIVGIVCMILFAACLCFFTQKLLDHSPAVIIDEEGILDNSSYIAGGLIRWDDIHNIELYQLVGQNMIGIHLKDPDSYLERQQGLKRQLIKINQGMVQAPINIAQSALRMSLVQIYKEMNIRWHSHHGRISQDQN